MSVDSRRSWLTTRARSTQRTGRRRSSRLLPGGLGEWLLEVRCLLSTAQPQLTTSGLSGWLSSGQAEIIDVSTTPVLELNGNLNNQGTIYLVSTNPLSNSVSISAQNIVDGSGAVLTTVLPAGGLPGFKNAINDLSLTLVASQNIVNNGAISSAGSLTALAGGSITNAPASGDPGALASVQAAGEVELLSSTVANHGALTSTNGDVDVAVPSIYASAAGPFESGSLPGVLPQNININNTSGTIRALEGVINFGGPELGPGASLNLTGGNLAALATNLQAGEGTIQGRREQRHGCCQRVRRRSPVWQRLRRPRSGKSRCGRRSHGFSTTATSRSANKGFLGHGRPGHSCQRKHHRSRGGHHSADGSSADKTFTWWQASTPRLSSFGLEHAHLWQRHHTSLPPACRGRAFEVTGGKAALPEAASCWPAPRSIPVLHQ